MYLPDKGSSRILENAIPIVILIISIFMLFRLDDRLRDMKEQNAITYTDIIVMSAQSSIDTSVNIVEYINDRGVGIADIYNEEFESMLPGDVSGVTFNGMDNITDIRSKIMSTDKGRITSESTTDIYYQWIYSTELHENLLVLYTTNHKILIFSMMYVYIVTVIALAFIHSIVLKLIKRYLYINILQKRQKDSINILGRR